MFKKLFRWVSRTMGNIFEVYGPELLTMVLDHFKQKIREGKDARLIQFLISEKVKNTVRDFYYTYEKFVFEVDGDKVNAEEWQQTQKH